MFSACACTVCPQQTTAGRCMLHCAMPHGAVAQRMPHGASCRLAPTNKTGDYERHTDVPYGSVVARHYECSCA